MTTQREVLISLSAEKLVSKDTFSKSDAYVIVSMRNRNDRDSDFKEVGRTEVIKNNSNPKWMENVSFPYSLSDMQELKFELYDSDNVSDDDKIHEVTAYVSSLLKASQGTNTFEWGQSKLVVKYEKCTTNNDTVKMLVRCKDLPRMDGPFSKADPYFVVERPGEGGDMIKCYVSPIIKGTRTPEWKIEMPIKKLCNGATKVPLKISVFDWDKVGDHDLIGSCNVTLNDLVRDRGGVMELKHQKKSSKRGFITFDNVVQTHVKTFTDLIRDGLNMNVTIAVDFTGSNGHPKDKDSLHYINSSNDNQYQEAIRRIGGAVAEYDSDNKISLLGFGGCPAGEVETSHCFTLNNDQGMLSSMLQKLSFSETKELSGIEAGLACYKKSLNEVELSGPTLFGDVISHVMKQAESGTVKDYHVLVILTDGMINDMDKVRELIVKASNLPMSIIIGGVGNADFKDMSVLDSDNGLLRDTRNFPASRDIVNFVELDAVRRKGKESLAQVTLAELPEQVESYYCNPKQQRSFSKTT